MRQIFAKERNLASAASSFAAHHESLHSQAGTRHIILAREQPIATTSPPSPHHRGKGLERGLDSSHLFQTSSSHLSVSGLGRPERLVIATSTDASSYDPQLRSALLCFSFLEGLVLPPLYSYNLYSRSALLSFFLLRGVRPPPSTFLQPSAPLRPPPASSFLEGLVLPPLYSYKPHLRSTHLLFLLSGGSPSSLPPRLAWDPPVRGAGYEPFASVAGEPSDPSLPSCRVIGMVISVRLPSSASLFLLAIPASQLTSSSASIVTRPKACTFALPRHRPPWEVLLFCPSFIPLCPLPPSDRTTHIPVCHLIVDFQTLKLSGRTAARRSV